MLGISKSQLEVTPIVAYGGIFVATVFAFMGLESFWRHENALAEKVVAAQNELATKETLSESDEWASPIDVDGLPVLSFEFTGTSPDGKTLVSMAEAVASNPKRIVLRTVDFNQDVRDRRKPRLSRK